MKTEQIIKAVENIPGGRFFRIRYITQVKLAADFAKQGITVFKIVDTTTRTGVKYNKIKGVVPASYSEDKAPRANNWEWVVKDRIKHNTKTGKDYLVVAPIGKGSNTITTYIMTSGLGETEVVDKETVKLVTTPSYWKESKPAVMNITLENILMVK